MEKVIYFLVYHGLSHKNDGKFYRRIFSIFGHKLKALVSDIYHTKWSIHRELNRHQTLLHHC